MGNINTSSTRCGECGAGCGCLHADGCVEERVRAAVAAERNGWRIAIGAAMEEQEHIAQIENVPDDGRISSTGLRGQAAGRRAACAAVAAAISSFK